MSVYQSINNLGLVNDGLLHIRFEMNRSKPSVFRMARESHLVLYRSMIEALKGSANLAITGRQPKNRLHRYRLGDEPWKEIYKVAIPACDQAWRFSDPVLCMEPKIDYSKISDRKRNDYLISFYDALAMIQSECFMHQYVMSRELSISDDEMKMLEWLHEDIRNEYEHFIPKGYLTPTSSLIQVTILSLRISKELLFDSKAVLLSGHHSKIANKISNINEKLTLLLGVATAEQPD